MDKKVELAECISDKMVKENYINKKTIYELILMIFHELGIQHYTKPEGGIPKEDLAEDVQQALNDVVHKIDLDSFVKKDKFALVAFSGDYHDLHNTPEDFQNITIDSVFNDESNNPVENKIITKALNKLATTNENFQISVNRTLSQLSNIQGILNNKANVSQIPSKLSQLQNDTNFVKKIELHNIAFSGDYNDLKNTPTPGTNVIVDPTLSNSSTNPVQNKAITKALAEKQDKFTNTSHLFTLNGQPVSYNSIINIAGGQPTPGTIGLAGRGTLDDAITYASQNNTFFTWLLEDTDGTVPVRKIIWHIINPNIFIDAFGAIIEK